MYYLSLCMGLTMYIKEIDYDIEDSLIYGYNNDDREYRAYIEYNEEGNPYFTVEDDIFYLDEFSSYEN